MHSHRVFLPWFPLKLYCFRLCIGIYDLGSYLIRVTLGYLVWGVDRCTYITKHTHTDSTVYWKVSLSLPLPRNRGLFCFWKLLNKSGIFFLNQMLFLGLLSWLYGIPYPVDLVRFFFFSFLNYQVIFASLRWPPPLIMVFLVDSWILHPKIFSRIFDSLFTRDIDLLFYLFMMPSSTFISGWILGSVFISLIF